jgi:hypothetical protein
VSGRRQDWPRFSRAEIRHFAEWLDSEGWSYEGVDANGHTIWRHPQAAAQYKLPSTPKHFSVKLARADVYRLLGRKITGKRKKGPKPKRQRQDFVVRSVRRQTEERTRPKPMRYPVRCKWCGHVHDAALVKVETRYKDCSAWRCPGCDVLLDDRPERWGGSAIPVTPEPTPPRIPRGPKKLPWEDQPDDYDRGIAQMMRQVPGGRKR